MEWTTLLDVASGFRVRRGPKSHVKRFGALRKNVLTFLGVSIRSKRSWCGKYVVPKHFYWSPKPLNIFMEKLKKNCHHR